MPGMEERSRGSRVKALRLASRGRARGVARFFAPAPRVARGLALRVDGGTATWLAVAVWLFVLVASTPAAAVGPSRREAVQVLVLPAGEGVPLHDVAEAIDERGFSHVEIDGLAGLVSAAAQADRAAEEQARLAIEGALERTRAAFLAQQFDAMLAELSAIESTAAATLAPTQQCELAWELEFQRALALTSRAESGDAAQAERHFEAALAIDERREPSRELYGPDVLAGYVRARDSRARRVARDVAVTVVAPATVGPVYEPQIWIDCRPHAGSLSLRPGRHTVVVRAVGFRTHASVFEQSTDEPLVIRLELTSGIDGAWARRWERGSAEALPPSIMAHQLDREDLPSLVLWVSGPEAPRAQVIGDGERGRVAQGPSVIDAVAQALRWVADDGALLTPAERDDPLVGTVAPGDRARKRQRRRAIGKWLGVGAGVSAGVALALGLGLGLGLDDTPDRVLHVVAQ